MTLISLTPRDMKTSGYYDVKTHKPLPTKCYYCRLMLRKGDWRVQISDYPTKIWAHLFCMTKIPKKERKDIVWNWGFTNSDGTTAKSFLHINWERIDEAIKEILVGFQ